MKCKVCSKEATEKYCQQHEKSWRTLLEKYGDWRKSMDISWKEYLNEIIKNPYTGSWAKEVAEEIIKNGDR